MVVIILTVLICSNDHLDNNVSSLMFEVKIFENLGQNIWKSKASKKHGELINQTNSKAKVGQGIRAVYLLYEGD